MMTTTILVALLLHGVSAQPSKVSADMRPIRKVITLLQEMKTTAEKEASEDQAAYEKYACWCKTNEKEKGAAIEAAEQRIADLDNFVEVSTANAGQLKTDIAALEGDIAEDKEALATATGLREQENEAFKAEEADMKETRGLLDEAVAVLKKVQLLQKKGGANGHAVEAEARTALMQVRERVQKRFPSFFGTMQRDLFDVLGAMPQQQGFLTKRQEPALEQSGAGARSTTLLPWQKTEEQIGMEANPNDLSGMASGAKSYNARSGNIVGILSEMHREFSRDLASAQKAEFQALVAYQQLRAAKLAEIVEATKSKEDKEARLADTLDAIAKAKEDKVATEAALSADQKFLVNMLKNCKNEDDEYQARQKVRSGEIMALTETLKILTEDSARDLYENTMSFMQINNIASRLDAATESAAKLAAQDRAKERVMQRLVTVAKRQGNWAFASLAVRVRLDGFEKVKQVMDKMLAELQKQQKDDYAKWESCKADIDKTEDDIKVGENHKEDLAQKHQHLTNTIATLRDEIAALTQEVADMEISLKEAGEQRKAQNKLFQSSIADQRSVINILQKALTRLRQFYGFSQVHEHSQQEPGAPVSAPPPKPSSNAYEKSGLSGGVIQMLMKIIEDAESTEKVLEVSEQNAQEQYASFVQDTTTSIQADRASIAEKQGQVASTESEKAATHEAQTQNENELANLANLLKAHHLDCDYIIKYFDIRQKARAEEMDAINDAKAILSGADFN